VAKADLEQYFPTNDQSRPKKVYTSPPRVGGAMSRRPNAPFHLKNQLGWPLAEPHLRRVNLLILGGEIETLIKRGQRVVRAVDMVAIYVGRHVS